LPEPVPMGPLQYECRVRRTFIEVADLGESSGQDERLTQSDPTPCGSLLDALPGRRRRSDDLAAEIADRMAVIEEASPAVSVGTNAETCIAETRGGGVSFVGDAAAPSMAHHPSEGLSCVDGQLLAPMHGNDVLPTNQCFAGLNASGSSDSVADAYIGRMAMISGLVNSSQFNGRWCCIEAYDEQMQRYVVRVFQEDDNCGGEETITAKLRAENLFFMFESIAVTPGDGVDTESAGMSHATPELGPAMASAIEADAGLLLPAMCQMWYPSLATPAWYLPVPQPAGVVADGDFAEWPGGGYQADACACPEAGSDPLASAACYGARPEVDVKGQGFGVVTEYPQSGGGLGAEGTAWENHFQAGSQWPEVVQEDEMAQRAEWASVAEEGKPVEDEENQRPDEKEVKRGRMRRGRRRNRRAVAEAESTSLPPELRESGGENHECQAEAEAEAEAEEDMNNLSDAGQERFDDGKERAANVGDGRTQERVLETELLSRCVLEAGRQASEAKACVKEHAQDDQAPARRVFIIDDEDANAKKERTVDIDMAEGVGRGSEVEKGRRRTRRGGRHKKGVSCSDDTSQTTVPEDIQGNARCTADLNHGGSVDRPTTEEASAGRTGLETAAAQEATMEEDGAEEDEGQQVKEMKDIVVNEGEVGDREAGKGWRRSRGLQWTDEGEEEQIIIGSMHGHMRSENHRVDDPPARVVMITEERDDEDDEEEGPRVKEAQEEATEVGAEAGGVLGESKRRQRRRRGAKTRAPGAGDVTVEDFGGTASAASDQRKGNTLNEADRDHDGAIVASSGRGAEEERAAKVEKEKATSTQFAGIEEDAAEEDEGDQPVKEMRDMVISEGKAGDREAGKGWRKSRGHKSVKEDDEEGELVKEVKELAVISEGKAGDREAVKGWRKSKGLKGAQEEDEEEVDLVKEVKELAVNEGKAGDREARRGLRKSRGLKVKGVASTSEASADAFQGRHEVGSGRSAGKEDVDKPAWAEELMQEVEEKAGPDPSEKEEEQSKEGRIEETGVDGMDANTERGGPMRATRRVRLRNARTEARADALSANHEINGNFVEDLSHARKGQLPAATPRVAAPSPWRPSLWPTTMRLGEASAAAPAEMDVPAEVTPGDATASRVRNAGRPAECYKVARSRASNDRHPAESDGCVAERAPPPALQDPTAGAGIPWRPTLRWT